MQITVPVQKEPVFLEQLLLSHLKDNIVEDIDMTQKFRLLTLPKVLILQIKRHAFVKKVDTEIIFPMRNLDLARYIHQEVIKQQKTTKYDLCSIINHFGTKSKGHYYVERENSDSIGKSWFLISDQYARR